MTDTITLTGIIATDPRSVTTEAGLDIASFRLASTQRRWDRAAAAWADGETNWYTVTAFRVLAAHVAESLHKGERVVVAGRLRIRSWENGDKSGTTVEVDADAIGHDLRWGRSTFVRATSATAAPARGAGGAPDSSSAAEAVPRGDAAPAGDAPPVDDDPSSSGTAQVWASEPGPGADEPPAASPPVGASAVVDVVEAPF